VGSGDGIGARRAGGAPCVERAGVDVRERDTLARRRDDFGAFALERTLGRFLAGFAARATGRRDERRALTLTFRRDAAFNCIPLPLRW